MADGPGIGKALNPDARIIPFIFASNLTACHYCEFFYHTDKYVTCSRTNQQIGIQTLYYIFNPHCSICSGTGYYRTMNSPSNAPAIL